MTLHEQWQKFEAKQGWICPKCQCVYAPDWPECFSCNHVTRHIAANLPLNPKPEEPVQETGETCTDRENVHKKAGL